MKDMLTLGRALFHWARLGYYAAALSHVGHHHADAVWLTWRAIESQRVVDEFLAGRGAA